MPAKRANSATALSGARKTSETRIPKANHGRAHRQTLWLSNIHAYKPYFIGFNKYFFDLRVAMPRVIVRTFRRYSALKDRALGT